MDETLAITDPKRWEDTEFEWSSKYFYTVPLSCWFSKPRKVFEAFQRLRAEIASKRYTVPDQAIALMEIEKFRGRLLIEILKIDTYDASVMEMERSKFFSTLHHGPMKTISQTVKNLREHVFSTKGINPTSTYYWDFRHGPEFKGARADLYVVLCRV